MAQRLLEPFKKLPHQIQNFNLIQKLQELTGRSGDAFGAKLVSSYGCLDTPSAIAFDDKLGLFAVAWKTGCIKAYGTPGLVLTVKDAGCHVISLAFIPEEGRLLVALETGYVSLYQLNPKSGHWCEVSHVRAVSTDNEQITAMTLGHGIVYVGSSNGTLYQLAVSNGRLSAGDHALTSCTSAMVSESVPVEKREQLGVDSPIVALQIQPDGNHLLIAYAGGCVAVAIPQAIPENNSAEPVSSSETAAPTAEQEATTPTTEEAKVNDQVTQEGGENVAAAAVEGQTSENTTSQAAEPAAQPEPVTPTKGSLEKRATMKIKEFTRSLRRLEPIKPEAEVEPPLPVPPAPRITHLLIRDQPVEFASWRVTAPEIQSSEITVAYGDGAYQIWPITAAVASVGQELVEPIFVAKRDPPTTPYGPLPCGAIKKVIQHAGVNGGVVTAFSGGLPRAEFNDRHAVSVLQDQEHHVCFQFGSPIIDFIFIPQRPVKNEDAPVVTEAPVCGPSSSRPAAALLVMTERELVAIDLQQSNWPTFHSPYLNCLDVSPVTSVAHLTKVSSSLLERMRSAVKCAHQDVTNSQWPIWGGENGNDGIDLAHNENNDVVVLGHANGWITLVALGRGDSVYGLGTFHSDALFNLSDSPSGMKCHSAIEVETWPPFRRVGDCALAHPVLVENPDPRLAVTTLSAVATPTSVTVVVGGAAGQVSVWTAYEEITTSSHFEPDVSRISVNLIPQDSVQQKYAWKGSSPLKPFEGIASMCGPLSDTVFPCALLQLDPPAPITAVALEPAWNLLAVGSAHGFAVVDLLAKTTIYADFLYSKSMCPGVPHRTSRPGSVSAVQTAIVNRGKQLTATMRQSFRRLKNLRTSTTKSPEEGQETTPAAQPTEAATEEQPKEPAGETTPKPEVATAEQGASAEAPKSEPTAEQAATEPETSPTEQDTESAAEPIILNGDDFGPSTVRSILFADTYVISAVPATAQQPAVPSPRTPSLWVGTANGRVLAHSLNWEDTSGPVTIQLHKELQLQHHAPVIGLCVLDASSRSPVIFSPRVRNGCEVHHKPEQPVEEVKPEAPKEEETPAAEPEASAPAAPTPTVTVESHQLLVCSEEQVKLFQLPTLRALHKHKFIDRIRLPGHSSSSSAATVPTEAASSTKPADTEEQAEKPTEAPTEQPEPKPTHAVPQPRRKSLTAFGVQAFVRGAGEHAKTDWYVVVTRFDGQAVVLSIPHLRKLFKARSFVNPSIHPVPCVSSLSPANFVFWQARCQLILNELSLAPRLCSPALLVPGATSPLQTVILPEWARPHEPAPAEPEVTKPTEAEAEAEDAKAAETLNGEQVVNGSSETHKGEETDLSAPLTEKSQVGLPVGAPHAGDVTIDSIKEYLNGEGTVTIKTIETSSEKRTVVEGGHMVTTVHESERVDGKLIKDDVLKFSTDEPASLTTTDAV